MEDRQEEHRNPMGQICPVCDGSPRVLIAIRHEGMRRLILDLLEREHGCWRASLLDREDELAGVMRHPGFDLVIVDDAVFPRCCCETAGNHPRGRVVVVGPEPDEAYMTAARRDGAGGWVARDDVAEQLSAEMRSALGCIHQPCPPVTERHAVDASVDGRTLIR